MLSEVVRAVAGRCEVYLDGGARTGTDVFKALALGAKVVFVGRPVIYGLAYNVRLVYILLCFKQKYRYKIHRQCKGLLLCLLVSCHHGNCCHAELVGLRYFLNILKFYKFHGTFTSFCKILLLGSDYVFAVITERLIN